jgi:hypothetical protein
LVLGITLVAVLASSGSGGGGGAANAPALVQQNAHLGAPPLARAGLRVTFYNAAASIAQSRFAWVEDPTGPWEDPRTGKRYRRTDEEDQNAGIPNQDIATASGDGLAQVDVHAVEGNDIVFTLNLYGIDRGGNTLAFLPPVTSGGRVPAVAVEGTWIHPSLLAQLQNYNSDGVLVLRGQYPLNGRVYNALSFANTNAVGFLQYTYDTETGLLLSATTSTKGATSPFHAAGENPPTGNTQLTITRLAGYRYRAMPGTGAANPGWVSNIGQLLYGGTYGQINPIDPSSLNASFPMEVSVSLGSGGSTWAPFSFRSQTGMPGAQPSQSSGVATGSGPYWVDPQALEGLSPQQVLDQDPLTGETVQVIAADGGTVTIVSRISGLETATTYNKGTGVLSRYRTTSARTGTSIDLALQRGP